MPTVALTPEDSKQFANQFADAEPGTRFELSPGRYAIESLVSRVDLTVAGNHPACTVLEIHRFVGIERGSMTLEKLTLRGGNGTWGGAIEVVNESVLMLDQCILSGNQASRIGGAIHVGPGHATVTRCVFTGNQAPAGAALSVHSGSSAFVDRCLFLDNKAQVGGALMVNDNAQVLVKSCTFLHNQATLADESENEAEPEEGGAAVALLGTSAYGPEVRIVNCLFGDPRPLANYPKKPGLLEIGNCMLPPGSLERLIYSDAGDNLEADATWREFEGLPLLALSSPGCLMADIIEIESDAVDIFNRPLVVLGEADPGALAGR